MLKQRFQSPMKNNISMLEFHSVLYKTNIIITLIAISFDFVIRLVSL